jgi:RNA processing factor Prp31
MKNRHGVLFNSSIVQQALPEYQESVFRDLGNKVVITARLDLQGD